MSTVADPLAAWHDLRGPLSAYIRRRVARPEDAEDVLQEVMLRIHRHADELAGADRVAAWVHRIAQNAITDHYRRSAARPEIAAGASTDLDDRADDPGEPETDGLRRELSACLRPLIERLPEGTRDALTLVELDGLTQAEAASRLGISLSGAKSRVQRGRAQLKSLLLDCCHVAVDRRGGITEYRPRGGSCARCRASA